MLSSTNKYYKKLMLGVLFALGAALFQSLMEVKSKSVLKNCHAATVTLALDIYAFPILIVALFLTDTRAVNQPTTWLMLVLATAIVDSTGLLLFINALKRSDLSLMSPLLSITPIFVILISWVWHKEVPSLIGSIGIFL